MTYLLGLLVVLLSVVAAVGGLLFVRRLVPSEFVESLHSDASSNVFNAIALVFGVAVGFAILLVWGELNEAEATTQQEASNVEALYRLAEQLPEQDRDRIQEISRSYVQIVIDEEWPMMADGQSSSRAQNTVAELRRSIQEFEPQTTAEAAIYSQMLTKSDDLYENRELRLLETKEGVPVFVWVVLVITGILMVAFSYLFDLESPRVHALRIAVLAVAVALSLYTVKVVEYPFSGDVQVGPQAFEMVLGRL
jgi:uncharacterized protein YoaH (UPF0181 family)